MFKWRFALLVFFLLAAAGVEAQTSSARFVRGACAVDFPDSIPADCGMLIVPEDRSAPQGKQVRIAVAVIPAASGYPAPDPIFYLDGGPGASTLYRWAGIFDYAFTLFHEYHDVVLLDYRGAGESQPSLYCDEVADYLNATLDSHEDDAAYRESYYDALERCRRRFASEEHINLRMYNSAVIAQDVMDLREVLGYDEINLLGASYGTRLALTILRDHPEGIRSVLLDGVYPPQVNRDAENIVNANRAFEELFKACASSPACNRAFPNLRDRFYGAAYRLNEQPAELNVNASLSDDDYDFPLNGNSFIGYIFNALYSTWNIPSLPLIINQVASENYTELSRMVGGSYAADRSNSLGLYMSIECSDEFRFNAVKETIAATEHVPLLGDFYAGSASGTTGSAFDGCAGWGVDPPNPIENQPVHSDVPVLIFNGQFDPITPPGWGELAAQTLPNSRIVTFPGVGHGASLLGYGCPQQIASAFFDDPARRLDISCIDDTPIQWVTVDLSGSLTDTIARFESGGEWILDNHESTVYWNSASWKDSSQLNVLAINDYLDTWFPYRVDKYWLDRMFQNWGSYNMAATCSRGDLTLYEFDVKFGFMTWFNVRYWVDRRPTSTVRDVFLALPTWNESDYDWNSQKLFPELPGCKTDEE